MNKLARRLGLPAVIAISISAMLGSGIFVLPGLAAAKAGSFVWLAYVVAGICILPAALSKAELATAMPTSGGTYVYLEQTFGPMVGTASGLGLWLALLLKSAFALVGLTAYLAVLADVPVQLTALGSLVAIVAINMLGVGGVSRVQTVVVIVGVVCLGVLCGLGLSQFAIDVPQALPGDTVGFFSAVSFLFVAYAGVTKVAAIAEEIRNPDRNLPWGILISLGIVVGIYGLTSFVLINTIPMEAFQSDLHPIYTLALGLGGQTFGTIAAILGIVTMTSMANAGLLAASRFPFAMSRDKLLPGGLSHISDRFLTPINSILLSGVVIACSILILDVERLAKFASAFMIMIYVAENFAVVVLRESGLQWYKPGYRAPLYPWVQVLGIVSGIGLLFFMGTTPIFALLVVGVPGVAVYVFYGRHRTTRQGVIGRKGPRREVLRNLGQQTTQAPGPDTPPRTAAVVALFGYERSPETLVELGAMLAQGGVLKVLHLQEVPEQTILDALGDNPHLMEERRRISEMAKKLNVPLEFEAIMTRDVARTAHEMSTTTRAQWFVMEWGGRGGGALTIHNPIGWLRQHLSCNLAVFADAGLRQINTIIAHVEPGPHDALVVNTAMHLAAFHHAKLTLVRFVKDNAQNEEVASEQSYLKQLGKLCRTECDCKVLRGKKLTATLGVFAAQFDLLVTGDMSRKGIMGLRRQTSDKLVDAMPCSVLRLQTTRGQSHGAMGRTLKRKERRDFALMNFVDATRVVVGAEQMRKEGVFDQLSTLFATTVSGMDAKEILQALWQREGLQNTSVGCGLAFPHAIIPSAEQTLVAILTLADGVDYESPDGEKIDVFVATLGPPGDRETHLMLLASLSRMITRSDLLVRLRTAKTSKEIVAALLREVEQME